MTAGEYAQDAAVRKRARAYAAEHRTLMTVSRDALSETLAARVAVDVRDYDDALRFARDAATATVRLVDALERHNAGRATG